MKSSQSHLSSPWKTSSSPTPIRTATSCSLITTWLVVFTTSKFFKLLHYLGLFLAACKYFFSLANSAPNSTPNKLRKTLYTAILVHSKLQCKHRNKWYQRGWSWELWFNTLWREHLKWVCRTEFVEEDPLLQSSPFLHGANPYEGQEWSQQQLPPRLKAESNQVFFRTKYLIISMGVNWWRTEVGLYRSSCCLL